MSKTLEIVRHQATRDNIQPSQSEISKWEGVYSIDPANKFFVNAETAQIASNRVQDVLRRMTDSENPFFSSTFGFMQELQSYGQLETILQGQLLIGKRPAAAVVGTSVADKFKLELHINMQAVLNITGGVDLASILTHEVLCHGKSRLEYFNSLDPLISEADRVKQVQSYFMNPRNKQQDESQAYKTQSEAVILSVGHGLTGFGSQTLEDTATYCQTVRRGYDQKWDKFVAQRI